MPGLMNGKGVGKKAVSDFLFNIKIIYNDLSKEDTKEWLRSG